MLSEQRGCILISCWQSVSCESACLGSPARESFDLHKEPGNTTASSSPALRQVYASAARLQKKSDFDGFANFKRTFSRNYRHYSKIFRLRDWRNFILSRRISRNQN